MIARDETLRIGVYVCHCGSNIAGTVDVEALANFAAGQPNVVLARITNTCAPIPVRNL